MALTWTDREWKGTIYASAKIDDHLTLSAITQTNGSANWAIYPVTAGDPGEIVSGKAETLDAAKNAAEMMIKCLLIDWLKQLGLEGEDNRVQVIQEDAQRELERHRKFEVDAKNVIRTTVHALENSADIDALLIYALNGFLKKYG
jgi:hypothetical protein